MKELIEYIAKALVDNPDQVNVSEIEGEKTSVIELSVAKDDLGKVIGKQGRTARAMRTILSAASTKVKKRAVLEIIEPLGHLQSGAGIVEEPLAVSDTVLLESVFRKALADQSQPEGIFCADPIR